MLTRKNTGLISSIPNSVVIQKKGEIEIKQGIPVVTLIRAPHGHTKRFRSPFSQPFQQFLGQMLFSLPDLQRQSEGLCLFRVCGEWKKKRG